MPLSLGRYPQCMTSGRLPHPDRPPWLVDLGLALLTQVLLAALFPPIGLRWLAHVALVPVVFLATSMGRPTWRIGWTTFAASWVWWLVMVRWLLPVTGGGYVVLAGYLALYLPIAMLLIRHLARSVGWPLMVILPLVWVPLEWTRGIVLAGGFSWYALSHCHAPWGPNQAPSWLLQVADIGGEHAVSLLLAAGNGAVVDVVLACRRGDRRRRTRVALAWILLASTACLYGMYRVRGAATAASASIAVVQTNVPQNNKEQPTPSTELAMWEQLMAVTGRLVQGEAELDLVVWPESSTPGGINEASVRYYGRAAAYWARIAAEGDLPEEPRDYYQWLAAAEGISLEEVPALQARRYERFVRWAQALQPLAVRLKADLAVGALTRDPESEGNRRNSVYVYRADGRPALRRYDKIHLVPFGEYVPWISQLKELKALFIRVLTPYDHDYTVEPGSAPVVFFSGDGPELRWTPAICFEDTVGNLVRRMVHPRGQGKVDLLVNVSNDGWFAGTPQGYHHMQVAVLRCVENRVPMARSVNTGPSGFIDATGRIGPLVAVDGRTQDVAGVAVHRVQFDRRRTLFSHMGQRPVAMLTVVMIAVAIHGCFARRRDGDGTAD